MLPRCILPKERAFASITGRGEGFPSTRPKKMICLFDYNSSSHAYAYSAAAEERGGRLWGLAADLANLHLVRSLGGALSLRWPLSLLSALL